MLVPRENRTDAAEVLFGIENPVDVPETVFSGEARFEQWCRRRRRFAASSVVEVF